MKNTVALFIISLLLLMTLVGPYFTICSINTLFDTNIPHNWTTWFATLWLMFVISVRSGQK